MTKKIYFLCKISLKIVPFSIDYLTNLVRVSSFGQPFRLFQFIFALVFQIEKSESRPGLLDHTIDAQMFLMGFREENAKKLEGVTTRETHVWSRRYEGEEEACLVELPFIFGWQFLSSIFSTLLL